jgi:hypothetical protein
MRKFLWMEWFRGFGSSQSIMLKVRSSVPGSNNKSCMYYYCSYILSVLTDVPELITVLGSTPTLLCTRFMLIENNTVLSSILYCRSSPQIHVRPPLCRPQGGQGCRSGPFSLSGGEKANGSGAPSAFFLVASRDSLARQV